jgi:pectate lyase
LKRRIILAASAVTVALVLPAAASAATPGSTPTGVSQGTAEVQQGTVQTGGCATADIALVQNDATLRWSFAPVGPVQTHNLVQVTVDPPAKKGDEQDETETEDQMREREEMMDRLLDMLNRFNRTRDDVAGGIG